MKKNLLTALALSVSLIALTGCGDDDKEKAVKSYANIDACKSDIASDATEEEREKITKDCQTAADQSAVEHERTATHYAAMDQCSALYEQCVPAQNGNGFVPFMTGFMLGYVSGSPIYHPYYYDRYHVVYSGGDRLGYYRSGYVVAPPGATWTRTYQATPIPKGTTAVPPPSTRGGFGGSASAFPHTAVTAPASPSGRGGGGSSFSSPSASSRGGFGGSAASAASSSSG